MLIFQVKLLILLVLLLVVLMQMCTAARVSHQAQRYKIKSLSGNLQQVLSLNLFDFISMLRAHTLSSRRHAPEAIDSLRL